LAEYVGQACRAAGVPAGLRVEVIVTAEPLRGGLLFEERVMAQGDAADEFDYLVVEHAAAGQMQARHGYASGLRQGVG